MDFVIKNEAVLSVNANNSFYYNGKSINQGVNAQGVRGYTYEVTIKFPTLPAFTITKDMEADKVYADGLRRKNPTDKELTAANALLSTLKKMLDFFTANPPAVAIPAGRGIFDHYYRYFSNSQPFFRICMI